MSRAADRPPAPIAGIVLCGGHSRRMGRPKAWLSVAGEPLLARTVRRLAPRLDPLFVVAAREQPLPPLDPRAVLLRDSHPDQGPLRGLATGLAALPPDRELAFVAACDLPCLDPRLIDLLAEHLGAAQAAVPRLDDRLHPLTALYRPAAALPVALALLDQGRRRLRDLLEGLTLAPVPEERLRGLDPALRLLSNLNTPADYEAFLTDPPPGSVDSAARIP